MHLFFYGVLLGSVAEGTVRELLAGIGPGRPATTGGRLYAVPDVRGAYPVLVPGAGVVHGMVHEAGGVDLDALDRFEGVDPHEPSAGEYRRESREADVAGEGRVMADAYLYNRTIAADFVPIHHGDFARWLRETGTRPFTAG
jgi:gamma-glutamylcyclotransferase (GGCT)/AIG2-like uncharacterized protein YtfP